MSPIVVKCGGAVAESAAELILELAETEDVVVVHGAGPQISAEMTRRGLEVQFVGGRRVTTKAGLEVVRESLASVNETLCAAIGPLAVPLFGDEIGIHATQVAMLGLVGDPIPCAPSQIVAALAEGLIPVIAPLAQGPLNVNADEAAAAIAVDSARICSASSRARADPPAPVAPVPSARWTSPAMQQRLEPTSDTNPETTPTQPRHSKTATPTTAFDATAIIRSAADLIGIWLR